MADEPAQAPEEDQDTLASEGAPDTGTRTEETDEYTPERARGLHAELTKAQQELADVKHQKELWGRAQQGDLEAMRELNLPVDFGDETDLEDEEESEPLTALEQRQAAMEQWAQQREAQEGMNRFNADLDSLLAEKKINLSQRDRLAVFTETVQKGDSPEALKAVVEELAAERAAHDKAVIDGWIKSKKAPYVSQAGTGATEVPYRDDMSIRELTQAAVEQARLANQD